MKNLKRLFVLGVAVSALVAPALGQSDGTITLLVGYSAGGSADFAARVVAPELGERLGRTVVVENATGASGMIALQNLLNGGTDGSILYYGGFDTVAVPMVNKSVGIDWKVETIPVGRTAITSMSITVPAASPYTSLGDLVAAAKAEPDTLTYGTPGIGSAQHFVGEMISTVGDITLVHAPYQGGAQVATDLLAGLLDSAVLTTSTALPFIKDGQVRALAVTSSDRSSALPDVPALGEIPGFEGVALPLFQGVFVKAGTSPEIVAELSAAIADLAADPDVVARLAESGFVAAPLEAQPFAAFIDEQQAIYASIIDGAQISVE
ncbi:Bug family tripartite tricarboxylate transporter substrate binding protein [Devosia sp. SL43]|uniref:Bug family tripartite tricarboxylate transporter substrate binding protein n=1 Tax=Devosia sp. SL43 TaxID=2806348 RepID=UPI001F3206A3|nr:tripartite tricarboxylate transporter substrate binding protein [Devosia sp. SL43]UJW84863.1 tripartite tricarboxylate transporter substrate binding protein [Devosia sp. SL43]